MATAADSDGAGDGAGAAVPSVGERLRAAREKSDMSTRDAARLLNLDHWMVEALESDDFEALGAPVFAKGHMRTYALLLGLEPDDLMISYYAVQGSTEAPPIVAKAAASNGRGFKVPWTAIALAALGLAVLAAIAWWFLLRDGPAAARTEPAAPAESSAAAAAPAPVDTVSSRIALAPAAAPAIVEAAVPAPEATTADAPPSETPPYDDTPTTEPVAERAPVAAAPPPAVAAAPAAPGEVRLRLEFRDDSWVEVHDAGGNRLLWDLRRSGAVEELRGRGPIEVFLGRAAAVALEVDGEPYAIPAGARRRDTARFRVGTP